MTIGEWGLLLLGAVLFLRFYHKIRLIPHKITLWWARAELWYHRHKLWYHTYILMSRTQQRRRVEDIEPWRKHYLQKYGTDLVIALNRAMDATGLSDEELAEELDLTRQEITSIRCGIEVTLKIVARVEKLSGETILTVPELSPTD